MPLSPFPSSSSAPGKGHLTVQLLPQSLSALSRMTFQYPLKLISPSPTPYQLSILVFLLTYGGGLVGGDQVHLTINVLPFAKLSLVTQGHTKVFKSPKREVVTRQRMEVKVEKGAGICLLPDPVQPFGESVYEQIQIFTMEEDSSVCLLDWVSAGRTARGEDWDLSYFRSNNEVWTAATGSAKPRLLVRDNIILEGNNPSAADKLLRKKMQELGIFGTLILRGLMVEALATFFLAEFDLLPRIGGRDFRSREKKEKDELELATEVERWREERLKLEKEGQVLWSAARVRGCTVIKFGARTVEHGRLWIGSMMKWEGSVKKAFGEDALMCVK